MYTIDWLEDPAVFRVNQLEAHSDHEFFEKREEMGGNMPLRFSLNGQWRFSYAERPDERIRDFWKPDYDAADWDLIQVPGHMETQGYGQNQYVNTMYAWDGIEDVRPPRVRRDNPVGSYVKDFELPAQYEGKRLVLSFEGVSTAMYLWINGTFAGYAEDSFTPSEFDVTELVHAGTNRICVEVYKYSSASWIEDQDFFLFSGIFRDVNLYALPCTHINDVFVTADVADDFATADVNLRIKLTGKLEGRSLLVEMKDAQGSLVCEPAQLSAGEVCRVLFSVGDLHLWSAEDPYRYQLEISVLDENEQLVEIAPVKYGIRRFEMKHGVMHLNGKRIIFRGVNRHEFNPRSGRVISREDMLWDIRCMKRNNINADRTCHYPNNRLWYELCDEYGIYLIDETNLESHGTWQKMGACDPSWNVPADLPEWNDNVVDRARSMFERDKNHPSVLIWSCGNESYAGEDIMNITRFFHDNDPYRLVHYEGCFWNREYECISDMESRMYAKPAEIAEYLDSHPAKPYISCEYMHAMGNSCGGMKLYTDLEDQYEQYQGGFIWDFIDQALWQKRKDGKEYLVYGGYHDERPSDYGFSTNGIVYADRRESPKMQEVKQLYAPILLTPDKKGVNIRNRNMFVTTQSCQFRMQTEKEGVVLWETVFEANVPPLSETYVELPFKIPEEKGEYLLNVSAVQKYDTLWAEAGHEISFGQMAVTVSGRDQDQETGPDFHVVNGDVNIGVMGEGFRVLFSKVDGGLVSLIYDGTEYITNVPKVTYWRASTDNDRGMSLLNQSSCYLAMTVGQKPDAKNYSVEIGEDFCRITVLFQYPVFCSPVTQGHSVSYLISGDGSITVTLDYPGIAGMPPIPAFGMEFKMKERFENMRYYGAGPEENYIDRDCGARLGVFETTAKDNYSDYLKPQECGNRTKLRWISVTDETGDGLRFEAVDCPLEGSLLPYSAMEMEHAMLADELPDHPYNYLRILGAQCGVGGDDSWGAPIHEEYLIPGDRRISFSFRITHEAGK
ncbi:MAG: glycoside hydrolase family 2 TIM barrel-domain containing protein [Lachnospiraceae bacterium]|nr:glycoside hydrolase family 2 TIM barrel-domain containing protein [Lachnospiraceae bacterium]